MAADGSRIESSLGPGTTGAAGSSYQIVRQSNRSPTRSGWVRTNPNNVAMKFMHPLDESIPVAGSRVQGGAEHRHLG